MKPPAPPNILLLFTDQQRYDTINALGFPYMRTPNLDRIVKEGYSFSRAYSPNPVCMPARHNLLTGLPARYHGYSNNCSRSMDHTIPTLPRILADHGYITRAIGKMHFHPSRCHHGFHKMELMEEICQFREDDEYAMYLKSVGLGHIQNIHGVRNLLFMAPQRSLIPEEHHGSTWVGRRAADFIRTTAGQRPFFLWASWIAPHPPFDVCDEYADMYKNRTLSDPILSKTPLVPNNRHQDRYADLPRGQEHEYLRRMREVYFAAVTQVDRNIGCVLQALEETGQIDNTLILFTSDHGEMLGDHGCFQKMLPYDSCARIPFIMRCPKGMTPRVAADDFVDLNDVLPTFLDAAGISCQGQIELPGASLLRERPTREYQYMEHAEDRYRWISMRDRRYKFNYYYGGGFEELYDMIEDPGETTNLLCTVPSDPEVVKAREKLRKALLAHEERWGLQDQIAQGEFLRLEAPPEDRRRNMQFPRFPRNLPKDEREAMNDFGSEVIAAVAKEKLIRLNDLDLDAWQKNDAPPELVEQIRKNHL